MECNLYMGADTRLSDTRLFDTKLFDTKLLDTKLFDKAVRHKTVRYKAADADIATVFSSQNVTVNLLQLLRMA